MILPLVALAVIAGGIAVHKHVTINQVKAEIAKFEVSASADAKTVIAKIKSLL